MRPARKRRDDSDGAEDRPRKTAARWVENRFGVPGIRNAERAIERVDRYRSEGSAPRKFSKGARSEGFSKTGKRSSARPGFKKSGTFKKSSKGVKGSRGFKGSRSGSEPSRTSEGPRSGSRPASGGKGKSFARGGPANKGRSSGQQDRVVENQPRAGPVRVDQARAGAVEKGLREGRSFSKRQGLRR